MRRHVLKRRRELLKIQLPVSVDRVQTCQHGIGVSLGHFHPGDRQRLPQLGLTI